MCQISPRKAGQIALRFTVQTNSDSDIQFHVIDRLNNKKGIESRLCDTYGSIVDRSRSRSWGFNCTAEIPGAFVVIRCSTENQYRNGRGICSTVLEARVD